MPEKKVLILGLFVDDNAKTKNIQTAEDRMAAMFQRNGISVITASSEANKVKRLIDTVVTIISKRKEYDIAIVPLFGTWPSYLWQEIATRTLKLLSKKIILGIHGGSIPERIGKGAKRFFKAVERADILFAPSAYFKDIFERHKFLVRVIQNPVDLSAYTLYAKEKMRPSIIWMRAFEDVYNPMMSLRVAKKLATKYPNFKMVMAGKDGPLLNEVKAFAAKENLTEKITLAGYINMQQKHELAQQHDIYICTNKLDNAPVSLVEFMCFGLPVVSVNVGGIPYMIKHEENGLLVNADDDEAMFQQVCKLIEDNALAQSIIKIAHAYAQQYDEANVMKQWTKIFSEIEHANTAG